MRRLTITLAAAVLALGSMALTVSAQTQQPGAASLHGQAQNATPIHAGGLAAIARRDPAGFAVRCAAGARPASAGVLGVARWRHRDAPEGQR